ncbi:Gfo/Idh/MocA family protein [Paenibacillus sp. XY044]|uniref:Gfo/Idh/MocA family protein n=1 Tax=Paenibacillus sp. XY044 TaxID=2026089 RepID=UPI000B996D3D|nr:Gfo/Idh/MocA family oxidoreductase [Paenibacillus sp. XY044]OZB90483.1 oxidoreductase [Paenibacillus sp. XY044]
MRLGVIGYGFRISLMIREMEAFAPGLHVAAVTDVEPDQVRHRMGSVAAAKWAPRFYERADEMLEREQLDAVLIGTRCSLHAEMAVKVLSRGIPLFLEKPVATQMAEWSSLYEAACQSASQVVVSFPLRMSGIVQLVKEIVDSGKIGTVEHVQALNNVPYGGVYFHDWYRDERETGGLFLQKATHDFDYIHHIIGGTPVRIGAMTSKRVFRGNKPAGLRCFECGEAYCAERVSAKEPGSDSDIQDYCCFAQDTGNEDSGSALLMYDSGMHVSYSQNFFARRGAARRGARLLGYKGTLEFDFYTQTIHVDLHHTPQVETYRLEAKGRHFGGDAAIAGHFVERLTGRAAAGPDLEAGLRSALICLKARESAEANAFQEIEPVIVAANEEPAPS